VFVLLNRKQIEESPSVDMDEPVSRQYEAYITDTMDIQLLGWSIHVGGNPYILRDRSRWGWPPLKQWDGTDIFAAPTK